MRTLLFVLTILVVQLVASAGSAQGSADQGSAEYTKVIKQAVTEFDAGNWLEARVLFQRAHALSPNARTWRSLGITAFEMRRYVDAIAELEGALADNRKPLTEQQRKEVQDLLNRARAFVAVYQVTVAPQEAEVIVDGQPAMLKDGQLYLDPGHHVVTVRAPGYLEERKDLRIDEPRRDELTIELKVANQSESEAEPAKAAAHTTSPSEPRARKPRIWTWVLGGTAVAAGAVAVGLRVGAVNKHDEYKNCEMGCGSLSSKGQSLEVGSMVTFGVAGAALAGAVVAWFLEGRSPSESPRTALYMTPWGAGVRGKF